MAESRKNSNKTNQRLKKIANDDQFKLNSITPEDSSTSEKNTSKTDKEISKSKPKNKIKSEYKSWLSNWKPGDALPVIPPGKRFVIDKFPGTKAKPEDFGFQDIAPPRVRSINEIGLMASKSVLGRTLNNLPGVQQLIAMVATQRGIIVDEQGKLRCPAGTPAANQFTDLQMSNCAIPSAATLANEARRQGTQAAGKITGAMANAQIGNRVPDENGVLVYGELEAARRYLAFKKRHQYQAKIVAKAFGNIRNPETAKKAVMRAFPNTDEKSLDRFLKDFGNLTGQDLLDYINIREAFLTSLLYEAMKNPDAAAKWAILWTSQEDSVMDGDGFQISLDTTINAQPFVAFNYNLRNLIKIRNEMSFTHLGMGYGSDLDEPLTPGDFGAYLGGHEFGHLADFHAKSKRIGIDLTESNYEEAFRNIDSILQSNGMTADQAASSGLINKEQAVYHKIYDYFEKSIQNATSDQDLEDALQLFYDSVGKLFEASDGLEGEDFTDELIEIVGSSYGQTSKIELHAEFYKAASTIPEILQTKIDDLNIQRQQNGEPLIPSVKELSEKMFGVDLTDFALAEESDMQRAGMRRRVVMAGRAFRSPDTEGTRRLKPEESSISDITDQRVENLAKLREDNLIRENSRRAQTARRSVLDDIFKYYSPEELQKIIDSIPDSAKNNNAYIQSLLTVPEKIANLRTPNGRPHSAETVWLGAMARAISEDWIDNTALMDAYALRGNKGPIRTITATAKENRRVMREALSQRQQRRIAQNTARKISGSINSGTQRSIQKNEDIIKDIQDSTDFYNPERLTPDMTDSVKTIVTPETVAAMRQSIKDMPVISEEKQLELKAAVEKRGIADVRADIITLGLIFGPERVKREISVVDGIMTHNSYYGPGLPLAIERELALASGDTEKVKKIDDFINYLNTATESQIIDDLTEAANNYGDGFDRRISVFIQEPQKFLDSGTYYTQFDIDARNEAGIRSTTGSGTDVRSARRTAESTYGIPETLDDKLRPASGIIQQTGLGNGRRNNLKSQYGDDVQITEDYTIGSDVNRSSNAARLYGTSGVSNNAGARIILKPHVSDRSRFTSADSMAFGGASGVKLASSESLSQGASAIGFVKGDPMTGLLYNSMVDDGLSLMNPSVGVGTAGYVEALVPGSFSLDDVEAIVIDGSRFGRADRAVGAKIRDNGSTAVGMMNPDAGNDALAFSEFVKTRQEVLDKHGTTLVLDSADLGGVDSVELFNPEMTQKFVKDIMPNKFPYIKDEDIKPESTVADMILLNHLRSLQDGNTENTSFSKELEQQLVQAAEEKNVDKFKELLEQGRLEAIQAVTEAINGRKTATRKISGSISPDAPRIKKRNEEVLSSIKEQGGQLDNITNEYLNREGIPSMPVFGSIVTTPDEQTKRRKAVVRDSIALLKDAVARRDTDSPLTIDETRAVLFGGSELPKTTVKLSQKYDEDFLQRLATQTMFQIFGGEPEQGTNRAGVSPELIKLLRESSPEELEAEVENAVRAFHGGIDPRVHVQIPQARIKNLFSDGRYKTTHEVQSDHSGSDVRTDYESTIGIPRAASIDVRPASGYVVHRDWQTFTKNAQQKNAQRAKAVEDNIENIETSVSPAGAVGIYGNTTIRLKPELSERTRYGWGDSFNNLLSPARMDQDEDIDTISNALMHMRYKHASINDNVEHLLLFLDGYITGDFSNMRPGSLLGAGGVTSRSASTSEYAEALIMGSFELADIEEIELRSDAMPWLPKKYFPQMSYDSSTPENAEEFAGVMEKIFDETIDIAMLRSLGATDEEIEKIKTYRDAYLKRIREDSIPKLPTHFTGRIEGFPGSSAGVLGEYLSMVSMEELRQLTEDNGIKLKLMSRNGMNPLDIKSYSEKEQELGSVQEIWKQRFIRKLIDDTRKEIEFSQMNLDDIDEEDLV